MAPTDSTSTQSPERVWLDTDPGMGVPGSDIDDGLAILLLLASPELSLEGISLTFGNVSLDDAAASCQRIVQASGCTAPVHRGAEGPDALHRSTAAAQAIVDGDRPTGERACDHRPGTGHRECTIDPHTRPAQIRRRPSGVEGPGERSIETFESDPGGGCDLDNRPRTGNRPLDVLGNVCPG